MVSHSSSWCRPIQNLEPLKNTVTSSGSLGWAAQSAAIPALQLGGAEAALAGDKAAMFLFCWGKSMEIVAVLFLSSTGQPCTESVCSKSGEDNAEHFGQASSELSF